MKNIFKKLLICFLIIPTFFIFGCKNSTPPSNPPSGDQTQQSGGSQSGSGSQSGDSEQTGGNEQTGGSQVSPEEQAKISAYAIINNLAKHDIYTGFQSVEVNVKQSTISDMYHDISKTNVSQADWDTYSASVSEDLLTRPFSNEDYLQDVFTAGIDNTNHTGYKIYHGVYTGKSETTQIYEGNLVNFVSTPPATKTATVVDENHINDYKYNFNNKLVIASLFTTIGQTDSYTNLSTAISDVIDESYKYYMDEINPSYTPTGTFNVNIEINTLENNQYELVIYSQYGSTSNTFTVFTQYNIKFSNQSLLSMNVQTGTIRNGWELDRSDLKSYFNNTGLDTNTAFPSGSKVCGVYRQYSKTTISFNTFNTTKLLSDFTGYDLSGISSN